MWAEPLAVLLAYGALLVWLFPMAERLLERRRVPAAIFGLAGAGLMAGAVYVGRGSS